MGNTAILFFPRWQGLQSHFSIGGGGACVLGQTPVPPPPPHPTTTIHPLDRTPPTHTNWQQ